LPSLEPSLQGGKGTDQLTEQWQIILVTQIFAEACTLQTLSHDCPDV
jgi:hypothetical protein